MKTKILSLLVFTLLIVNLLISLYAVKLSLLYAYLPDKESSYMLQMVRIDKQGNMYVENSWLLQDEIAYLVNNE